MSWCDSLASTPGAGFRLGWHFSTGDHLYNALTPILNRNVDKQKPQFSVEKVDASGLVTTTFDGFQYSIDPSKSSVTFQHRLRPRRVSAGVPVMEMVSNARPFSLLLGEVSERLVESTMLTRGDDRRTFDRVGIVSHTAVAAEDLPPGLARMLSYMQRPWAGSVESMNMQITGEIVKNESQTDRCTHSVNYSDDAEDNLITIQLDWQRIYSKPMLVSDDNLKRTLRYASESSAAYFEELAVGARFDERYFDRNKN